MRNRYLPAPARTGVLMKPLFLADHPAIDFLNTNLAPDGRSIELLGTGTEYVEWLMAANLLDKKRALDLTRRISGKALDSAAEEARRVREWMRAWLTRWRSNPEGDYRKEIAALNALLSRATYSRAVRAGRKWAVSRGPTAGPGGGRAPRVGRVAAGGVDHS